MEEIVLIVKGFIERMGEEGKYYSNISNEVIDNYKGVFVINRDEEDVINFIWKNYGLRSYKNGLFWLVNPEEYNDLARQFPNTSNDAIVFARTGIGNLFLLEQGIMGKDIYYLNTHTGQINLISRGFETFLEFDLTADSFWKRECYGKIELKANKKYGQMEEDECYTFVPALALGGDEKISNLEKVKIKENLSLLAQLHSS